MKKQFFKVLSAILLISLILSVIPFAASAADNVDASAFTSVILNVGADETQKNLTWYYQGYDEFAEVRYGKSTSGSLPIQYQKAPAVGTLTEKEGGYYSYKATMTGLQENSTYAYQLVVGNTVSKTYTFKTYDFDDGFTFAFTGDTQIGSASNWADTLNKIQNPSLFGNVSFIVSPGDQISTYNNRTTMEGEYDGYIASNLSSIAVATTIGPWHDAEYDQSSGEMLLADAYRDHYNLPNLSDTAGVTETTADYYYTYGNVLFMHLNVTNYRNLSKVDFNAHVSFIQKTMKDNPQCNWQIVVMHYPFYTTGSHTNDSITNQFRSMFAPKFNELGIDIVLQGHDHMYTRSHMMTDATVISKDKVANNKVVDPVGTLYVAGTSSSGGGFYGHTNDTYSNYIAVERPEYRKGATFFEVTDNSITLKSYFLDTATPELIDTFTIEKTQVEYNYSATVTVDGGEAKQYDDKYDLSEILAIYNTSDYKNKEILIKLESDLELNNAVEFVSATGATFKIDLNGYTLTTKENEKITISAENTTLEFYSSFEDGNLIIGDYIYFSTSATVNFGSKEYRNNLTVTSSGYLMNLATIPTGTKIETNLLYSNFNYGTNGIITLLMGKAAFATLNINITGSTLNGSTAPFQYNTSKAPTTGGAFTIDSSIVIKDTSFVNGSTTVGVFEGANFADRYFGTVTIEDSSFDGYELNGDTILADENATRSGNYLDTLTDYDPTKAITVGARTIFKNSANTFANGAFTASNVNLGPNSTIKTNGDATEVAYSFDFTAKVTVDGVAYFPTETSLYDILEVYNSVDYAGKEIIITLNKDVTTPNDVAYTFDKADNVTVVINLAGYTWTIGSNGRLILASNNYNFTIYSSEMNGKLYLNDGIQPSSTGTLIFGSKADKDYLEIYSPDASPTGTYVVDLGALEDGAKLTIKFLYSVIRSTTNGLIRLNAATGAVATIDAEVIGCTIKGKHLIQFNSDNTPGVFSLDSKITFKNTEIVTNSSSNTQRQLFDKGVFANRYFGTMYFEYTSFDRYTINGDLIYSNKDVDGSNYYSSNVAGSNYDPNKVIVIGEGCKFTNTNGSVTADGFTAKNIVLAENCQIEMAGETVTIIYVEPEIPEEPTPEEPTPDEPTPEEPLYKDNVTVVIDETPVGYDITDIASLLGTLNSSYNGKTIYIYLNPNASYDISSQVELSNNNNYIIDLCGSRLDMGGMIPMTANAGIQIYSSRAGGKFTLNNRFHINGSASITLGYDNPEYTDYLTVQTSEYILYTGAIGSSVTVNINYLYTRINCSTRGLMRIRCSEAATLTSEIKGCTIVGTTVLIQSHTGYAGIFNETSSILLKDSTFTGPSGKVTNVFETSGEPAFVNKFAGTMTIDGCTFNNYCFNAVNASNTKIIVGDGTTFVNSGNTFTGNAFAVGNMTLASGCEIKAEGDKMVIVNTGAPDQPDTPVEPEAPVQPDMPDYPAIADQPETPKVTDAPAGTTAIVTIDGQTAYHTETDLYTILSIYNKAENEGKTINIELLADLNYTSENKDYVKANITINVAGKTLTLSRRLNIPSGTKLLVYSSVAGGKFDMYADQGFVQLYKNSELVLGHTNEQYKNFLTVSSAQYLIYTDRISTSSTNNVELLNTIINAGASNMLRVRCDNSASQPTFHINISGCTITGTKSMFMFETDGTFHANSTIFVSDTSFTGPSASQGFFDSGFGGKYSGTICFTGCTFEKYTINAELIPSATLIFGAGCSFTNVGTTLIGTKFTAGNNYVAAGCEIKADGSSVVIQSTGTPDEPDVPVDPDTPVEPDENEIPKDTTIIITVDGKDYYSSDSDIAALFNSFAAEYAGKEIYVKVYAPNTAFTNGTAIEVQGEIKVIFDLAGATLTMGKDINVYSNSTFQIYSSVAGAKLVMGTCRFHLKNNSTLTLGYDNAEYKGNLTVNTEQYILYTDGLSSGTTLTLNFLYSNINTSAYGLIKIRTNSTPKLVATIKGCTIVGSKFLFTSRSGYAGVFTDSTLVATDSTFTGPAGSVTDLFDTGSDGFAGRYDGTMTFTNCIFENYNINSNIIPLAELTFGDGCKFINSGATITDNAFTLSNNKIADGCELIADGSAMKVQAKVVEPEIVYNIFVTIDGNTVGYETTDLKGILNDLSTSANAGKTIYITVDYAEVSISGEVVLQDSNGFNVVLDLAGATLTVASAINIKDNCGMQVYSSKPGAKLEMGSARFQIYKNSTLTLGYDNAEYKGYLTVNTGEQIIYTTTLSSSSTITTNFYYSTINTGGYGLMRIRGNSKTATPTLNATIKGCTIVGKSLFFLNTSNGGIFSENSTVVAIDTTFTGPSGKVTGIYDSSFTDAFDGTMTFTGCTFANYTINSDIIEFATIEIGLGTSFTGYGGTIVDGEFANENITLVNGAILVKKGDAYVVEEYKEDTSKFTPLSNLTLYSDIQYNIYIPALDQIISATINGQVITSFEGYIDITVGGQKYYKVPVALGVANAMRDISLEIKYESELGGEKTLAYTLNIVKYANAILAGNYLEVEKTLIKDILSYIRSAYVYANTEQTASVVATINAIIGENYDETSKPTDIESAEKTNGLDSITMELGNAPAFIFYIADGYTADQYVIRVNGFTPDYEVITEGERTYIKVTMYAYAMVDTITYSIKGTDIKGEYNIKAYYEFALTKGEALTNLVERLWKYAESANAYREATK